MGVVASPPPSLYARGFKKKKKKKNSRSIQQKKLNYRDKLYQSQLLDWKTLVIFALVRGNARALSERSRASLR